MPTINPSRGGDSRLDLLFMPHGSKPEESSLKGPRTQVDEKVTGVPDILHRCCG
jgi:hypothetical protein